MANLEMLGGAGASPSPSGGKKKLKLSRKKILLYGSIAIAAFVLITSLMRKSQTSQVAGGVEVAPDPMAGGMPSNSADVAAQLQNFQSVMDQQIAGQFAAYSSEIANSNNSLVQDMTGVMGEISSGYDQKLKDQTEKYEGLLGQNNEALTSVNEKLVQQQKEAAAALKAAQDKAAKDLAAYKSKDEAAAAAQKKANDAAIKKANDAAAAAKKAADAALKKPSYTQPGFASKPKPKPAPKPAPKAPAKKLNTSTSIVDLLKSQGKNSSFAARSQLAAKSGIKNYKGTAAQNTALLKKVSGKK